MNSYDYVKLEALSLGDDETAQVECPECHRPKLSITRRHEGILYNCWRPSCSFQGFIGDPAVMERPLNPKPKKGFKPRKFEQPTEPIGSAFWAEFLKKYEMPRTVYARHGIKRISGEKAILMPLHDIHGRIYGHTTKSWDKSQKANHHLLRQCPTLHFMPTQSINPVVIVEDIISAIKVREACRVPTLALLGTSFSDDKVREMLTRGIKDVILWLDFDARHKALQYKKKLGFFFDSFRVVTTLKDPKETPINEIPNYIGD